ncbi:MAG: Gfo/Idh/MocA family oxidoreductase [Candidatus Hydrogenedentes bacterium]|nr:Gfo/Idh/MocA family oxidoreductase [Candidatus Hydrogenedentota bacterium]
MGTEFTRRNFMKGAGAAAGVMIATGFSPFSYAQNEKVRLGVIGTGGQGNIHIRGGLAGTPDVIIIATCDIYEPHQRAGQFYAWSSNAKLVDFDGWNEPDKIPAAQKALIKAAHKPTAYYEYKEMLEKEQLDAVLIATPLDTHYQITMDCLDADKFVFCEKTMCYTIEMARNVVQKAHEKGKFVQVGHQRRYNPEYNLAMEMARKGDIGRINHIDMQWHRNNNWRRAVDEDFWAKMPEDQRQRILQYSESFEHHMNWRIYKEKSLGLCTELLPHQADISNWFMGKMPARLYGTGGLDYWRDGRTTEDNISVVMEYELKPGVDKAWQSLSPRSAYQDKVKINKGYTVRVVYSSIMANAKRGASETIMGDNGALELTETAGCFLTREPHALPKALPKAAAAAPGAAPEAKPEQKDEKKDSAQTQADAVTSGGTQSYGGKIEPERLVAQGMELTPHMYQFRSFTHHIKNGGKPRTNEMCGLSTTIMSTLAYQAIHEGKVIEIDPNLMKFDFETPDWTEYGPVTA